MLMHAERLSCDSIGCGTRVSIWIVATLRALRWYNISFKLIASALFWLKCKKCVLPISVACLHSNQHHDSLK